MTVISDPLFYALAIPAVVALGLSKGGFVGVGQIGTPLLALLMPPLEAAAILLPIMLVQDAVSVWAFRKDWSGRNLVVMLPGAIVGIAAAWALAAHISDSMVRVAIGLITIIFVLYSWLGRGWSRKQPRPARGGAGTLVHLDVVQAGGPPFQMHVLPQNLAKMTFVGTTGVFFASVNALEGGALFRARAVSTQDWALAGAAARHRLNLLGCSGAHHAGAFYKITMVLMFVTAELMRAGVTGMLRG